MKLAEIIYALLILMLDFTIMYILLGVNLKNIKRLRFIVSLIIFALSLILSGYVSFKYGRKTFTAYFPLFVQLPIYLVYYLVSKYRGTKLFFVFLSTFIFSTPVIWSPFIVGVFVNYSIKIMTLASLVTYIITLVFVKKTIAPLFYYALENLQKSWLLLSSLPILYTIVSYLSNGYNHSIEAWKETSYLRVLILAIIYYSYIVIFVLFKQTREQWLWKNEQTILTMQMKSMKEHLAELKNSQTIVAIYSHD